MILNKEASTKLIFKKFLNSHLLKEHDLRLENCKKNKIMLVNFPNKNIQRISSSEIFSLMLEKVKDAYKP